MKKVVLTLVTLLTLAVSTQSNVTACSTTKEKVYNRVAIWENGKLLDENGCLWDFKFPNNKPCVVMLTVDNKGTENNTDDEIIKIKLL